MNLIRNLLLLAIKVAFASNIIIYQIFLSRPENFNYQKKNVNKRKSKRKLTIEIDPIGELT
jgi:hypothetical protein